jgi:hypothetical protein
MTGLEIAALLIGLILTNMASAWAGWWLRAAMARTEIASMVASVQRIAADEALTPGQPTCAVCKAPVAADALRQHDGRRLCAACKQRGA